MAHTKIGEALDLLRTNGWVKQPGTSQRYGENCVITALHAANGGRANIQWDRNAIAAVLKEQHGWRGSVGGWNDLPETTFADVERVMEKAEMKRLEEV
jgi:hypothetical protein